MLSKIFYQNNFSLRGKLYLLHFIAVITLLFALFHGNAFIKSQALFKALFATHPNLTQHILFELRLPRIFSAFITGGLLALSGCLMQALLQNPLADPYILGVSSGAAVGTLLCTLLNLSSMMITGTSWIGSSMMIALVWFLANKYHTTQKENTLLLTGIALASLCSAFISMLLILNNNTALHGLLFWLMGDLSGSNWPITGSIVLIIGFTYSRILANQLNVLVCGEQTAAALGISVKRLHIQLYLLASLMTATAVTIGGCIGFIGLLIPHILRLSVSSDYRYLLPTAMITGATSLVLADTCSQILFAPIQLPVGMMITLIGVPVFLILINKQK